MAKIRKMEQAVRDDGFASNLGKNWDEGLHNGLASFETVALRPPQDEEGLDGRGNSSS
jgi:hypothetical protein